MSESDLSAKDAVDRLTPEMMLGMVLEPLSTPKETEPQKSEASASSRMIRRS